MIRQKKVLVLGKKGSNLPTLDELSRSDIKLFTGSTFDQARSMFEQHAPIDLVIMGGGIPLEERLKIINHVYHVSEVTTVHMKDISTGPSGFVPFINRVLEGFVD